MPEPTGTMGASVTAISIIAMGVVLFVFRRFVMKAGVEVAAEERSKEVVSASQGAVASSTEANQEIVTDQASVDEWAKNLRKDNRAEH